MNFGFVERGERRGREAWKSTRGPMVLVVKYSCMVEAETFFTFLAKVQIPAFATMRSKVLIPWVDWRAEIAVEESVSEVRLKSTVWLCKST